MTPAPHSRPRSPMARRFGYYFLGVALGLVMVGFLLSLRQVMVTEPQPQGPAPRAER